MKYRKIAQEIIQMAKLDQKIRKVYILKPTYLKKMKEADRLHLTKIIQIIKQIGWPTISRVGRKASHLAWLLIQHADNDIEFQEYCLGLMKKEVEGREVTKNDIAFLTDRILVNKGMEQTYGTQFYRSKAGKLLPKPIKNINSIDIRRKDMNMQSFSAYLKRTADFEKQVESLRRK